MLEILLIYVALMETLSYENILTNIMLYQIDSTSLHLLFQRNFTLLNVINYQDFLYGISLPDIHLDLVFINEVLICQTLCPITLILQLPRYHRKPFLWRLIFKQIQRIK